MYKSNVMRMKYKHLIDFGDTNKIEDILEAPYERNVPRCFFGKKNCA